MSQKIKAGLVICNYFNFGFQLPRGGRKVSNSLRRGRQEEEAPPAPAEGAADAASDVPEWCDPTKPMGAWLNFQKIRVWCSDKGHTNFGPYGGVPSADAEADAPPVSFKST